MRAARFGRAARLAVAAAAAVALAGCGLPGASEAGTPPAPVAQAAAPSNGAAGGTSGPASGSASGGAPAGGENGVFEVTGSGTAITIDTDPPGPPGRERIYNAALPWKRSFTAAQSVRLLQVVVVGGDSPGCRNILGGKVVAEQPRGGSAHCVYDRG